MSVLYTRGAVKSTSSLHMQSLDTHTLPAMQRGLQARLTKRKLTTLVREASAASSFLQHQYGLITEGPIASDRHNFACLCLPSSLLCPVWAQHAVSVRGRPARQCSVLSIACVCG